LFLPVIYFISGLRLFQHRPGKHREIAVNENAVIQTNVNGTYKDTQAGLFFFATPKSKSVKGQILGKAEIRSQVCTHPNYSAPPTPSIQPFFFTQQMSEKILVRM